jgi:hypothetical protein
MESSFMTELKNISDQVIKIVCVTDDEKKLKNEQFMFLAASVNTKEQFINAIISYYQSKKLYGIVMELEKISASL